MAQLGITPESDPNVPAPAPVPDTPPQYPQAAPSPAPAADTQVGQPPADPQDLAGRIVNIQQKYAGDFNQLANAHVHAQRAMTQANQTVAAQSSEIRDLQQSMAQLHATVNNAIQGLNTGPYPGRPSSFQGPSEEHPEQFSRDAYDEDPVGTIKGVVTASIQENLANYEVARQQQETQKAQREAYKEREAEYTAWRPKMTEIFNENPELYRNMQPYDTMSLLYERAKERAGFETAQIYHAQISQELGIQPPQGIPGQPAPQQIDPNGSPYPMATGAPQGIPPAPQGYGPVPPGYGMAPQPTLVAPPQPGYPPAAAMPGQPGYNIPTGPTGGVRSTVPGQPPGGSWSKTPGMQHLWNAKSDSMDEMRAITKVLEERGFGNHLG
jgi:hypothetical protein